MAREADVLAGKGSLLDKLKKRREKVESGYMEEIEEPKPKEDDKRGYTQEKWEDNT